ncbi:MAG: hypothetical protein COA96_16795 [SAR86 cluster bacterium]|uniref:Uncharacterized protein n=1 Tax=SAR86 cluster bacterium TaxID=2030880 RepID=A0A2A5AHN4_9GAMM|nr:MAG: hypothetical protein COA96_16795 [SAR86 cluster bacterium]
MMDSKRFGQPGQTGIEAAPAASTQLRVDINVVHDVTLSTSRGLTRLTMRMTAPDLQDLVNKGRRALRYLDTRKREKKGV